MTDLRHTLVRTRTTTLFLSPDEYETVRRKRRYEGDELYHTTDLFGAEVAFLPKHVIGLSRLGEPEMEEVADFFDAASEIFDDDDPYSEEWKP